MSPASIRAVVVVVPVHDEAELLERCLVSLRVAIAAVDVECQVRIVLDSCSDASALIAARHPFTVLVTQANAVGAARAAGIDSALATLVDLGDAHVWIANTDADSVVPSNWLGVQLDLAAGGADVVLGTVRPDFDDLTPGHRLHWLDTHTRGAPPGNTHGANLGVRASIYREAGGFGADREHEDVRLVEACRAQGATVCATDAAEVMTSGRFIGRTPGGYAGFLRAMDRRLRREGARTDAQRSAS